MTTASTPMANSPSQPPILDVNDLCVELGSREVVCGVSFSVDPGDFIAILGPNGSGKSTLVRTVMDLVRPSSGSIELFGRASSARAADQVGYVPQIKSLDRSFPALAIELVASARASSWPGRLDEETRRWSEDALRRVGAAHLAQRQVSDLSGGEMQRVYLARALARSVGLLILDEPESGIDATGTADLYAQLDRFRAETRGAVLLVTHDWDAAVHHATRVLLLKGRQISFGTPTEALSEEHVRAAFGHVGHAHSVQTGSEA